MTLEAVEKRYKLNDFDGSIVEQIKNSLKPPLLTTNANGMQQLPAGFSMNHPLIKQHIDKHGNIDKNFVNLLQQHKLKQSQLQQQQQQQQAFLNGKNGNKRFKKDSSSSGTLKPSTTHHNVNISSSGGSSSSSLLSSDNLMNIKSNMNKVSAEFGSNKLQGGNNSSTKKLTVNTSATNRSPLVLNNNNTISQRLNELTGGNKAQNATNAAENQKKRSTIKMLNQAHFASVENAQAGGLDSTSSISANSAIDASLLSELKEYAQYAEELRLNDVENLDTMLNETKNRLSTSVETDGYWCFKRKDGCKYLAVSSLFIHFYINIQV
jgi:hypothetical protein